MASEPENGYEGWSILELFGHRRLGGFVRSTEIAGAGFFRIDIPGEKDGEMHSTQYYSPSSVYGLTPVDEAAAKVVARQSRTPPVQQWELPKPSVTTFDCPRCGMVSTRHCNHCDDSHPCSCMDDDDDREDDDGHELANSAPGIMDDF